MSGATPTGSNSLGKETGVKDFVKVSVKVQKRFRV